MYGFDGRRLYRVTEVVQVYLLHTVGRHLGNAHAVVDHQLCQLVAIDEDYFLLDAVYIFVSVTREL